MLQYSLSLVIGLDILFCWFSYLKENSTLRIVTKPPFCLLLMVVLASSVELKPLTVLFLVGLFFAFLGDTFLLMDGLSWFGVGLVCFLVCHVCYAVGYHITIEPGLTLPSVLVLVVGALSSGPLMQHAESKTQLVFTLPVHIYSCGLVCGMFYTLLLFGPVTGRNWAFFPSLLSVLGYACFVVSDAMLAWHTFVQKTMLSTMVIITTYHFAQVFLVLGLIANENNIPCPFF